MHILKLVYPTSSVFLLQFTLPCEHLVLVKVLFALREQPAAAGAEVLLLEACSRVAPVAHDLLWSRYGREFALPQGGCLAMAVVSVSVRGGCGVA